VARFFFHLIDDFDVPDEVGQELPTLQAAHDHAVKYARFTLAQTVLDEAKINFDHRIDIQNEHGHVLDSVRFRETVMIEG
jgi:hypothetical protein